MPQLPSGLHFALDLDPLQKIFDQAETAVGVHHLMAIETIGHLFQHIDVLYFRPSEESGPAWKYADESIPRPPGLTPYRSGFNLTTIRGEFEKWSPEDQAAFVAFLNEDRVSNYFQHTISVVKVHQEKLLRRPSTLPGLMATWWKVGCHPLQKHLCPHVENG